jgi:hypothetical protein
VGDMGGSVGAREVGRLKKSPTSEAHLSGREGGEEGTGSDFGGLGLRPFSCWARFAP